MTKCKLQVQLEILYNLFGPHAKIGQLFGIFMKKSSHHMSIVPANIYKIYAIWFRASVEAISASKLAQQDTMGSN